MPNLDRVTAQKVGGGVHDVGGMRRVVVRVLGMVVRFDHLEPGAEFMIVGTQKLADRKPLERLHRKMQQRPVWYKNQMSVRSDYNKSGMKR